MPSPSSFKTKMSRTVARKYRRGMKAVVQRVEFPASRRDAKQVVFVSGVQRSGTNMLMNLLDRSLETDVFMEKDPRAFQDYKMRDLATIRALFDASPARRIVIKALLEAEQVAQLLDLFAPARAIWMYRHFDDMIHSYMASWPGGRNRLDQLVQEGSEGTWRSRGMTAETYDVVCRHYRPGLDDASALALFWYYRNQLFFDQGLDRDPRVLLVNYEDLVGDPKAHARTLAEFVDVRITTSMTRFISPRSVRRKPPAAIDPSIRRLCESMAERLHAARGRQTVET